MDDVLIDKMKQFSPGSANEEGMLNVALRFTDDDGVIELVDGERSETYALKPLQDLYGAGTGRDLSTNDDAFMPLLLCIEEEIALFDDRCGPLSDAGVLRAMQSLSKNPEERSDDRLTQAIQTALRMNLSMNNYSRQEVRQAARKIGKSVERHMNSVEGYMGFIQKFFAYVRERGRTV